MGETNFLPATRNGKTLVLSGGHSVDAPPGGTQGETVTITIRPEPVRLVDFAEAGAIPAKVTALVYFGTDTHCYMALGDGTEIIARLQSPATGEAYFRHQFIAKLDITAPP